MHKILLLLFLVLYVNASERFKESRYVYAIDKEIHYEGSISFLKNVIQIDYEKPKKESISYSKDDATAQKRHFFTLLKAIYSGDETLLGEFFKIKKEGGKTILIPKEIVQDYIKQVEFKKSGTKLDFLKIMMKNNDWILIETL